MAKRRKTPQKTPKRRSARRPASGRARKPTRRKAAPRKQTQATKRRRRWRIAKWSLVVGLWLVLIVAGFFAYFAHDLPSTDHLAGPTTPMSVSVLAVDGSTIATYGESWGAYVPLADMAPVLPQAVLAIEDRRFFEHGGVDAISVLRAAWRNLTAGAVVEGGSTISQQVAKLVFLTPERSVKRKIQEAMLAFWLERKFSKEQILSIYLNRAYFGAGAYGVEAAARRYFGRSAGTVSLPQAAMIAGLLKAPSRLSPAHDRAAATARANVVLGAMVDAGFLSAADANDARARPAQLDMAPRAGQSARYFADWVLEQVPGYVGRDHGALLVHTTLDPRLQRTAQAEVESMLSTVGRERRIGQAALVALSPDGAVRAMVGGRSYRESQFNRATQARRQPGSAFKPFVYLAALNAGFRVSETIEDAPLTIGGWSPRNHDGRYRGSITLRESFAESVNTVAVRIATRVGIGDVVSTARRLGIESALPDDASLALGTGGVSLMELTGAYTVFANGGTRVLPHAIVEVRNRSGEVLYRRDGSGLGAAIDQPVLAAMHEMFAATVHAGTGRAANLPQALGQAYGKTGTSQDFRDAWFVGWADRLVTGVWLGNDDSSPMDEVTGGGPPAALWRRFMIEALGGSVGAIDHMHERAHHLARAEAGGPDRFAGAITARE